MFPCPACGNLNTGVKDSRLSGKLGLAAIRRRRVCPCGHRFTTMERADDG
jgi:transcriptional regulator NrdR family protein